MKIIALGLVSCLYGLIAARVFRRLIRPERLRGAVNRIVAHILEFSLFIDEPRIILRAQVDLIRANFRLMRQIALPVLIVGAIFAILYAPCDRYFGRGPLPVNEPVVVTVHSDLPHLKLVAPAGIVVETPGVRVARTHEISWRIRAVSAVTGEFEGRVEVPYPHVQWITWFLLISTAAALIDAALHIKYY